MSLATASYPTEKTQEMAHRLLAWFATHRRPLPWRKERNLYTVVVSEFMLQQTRVPTVIPYYERWMTRWPDWASLAAADELEVLRAWEGLGYYERVRRLHALAKTIVTLPALPQTAEGWKTFSGIGDYTAAAISSMVYQEPVALVDGNVIRILSRLQADERLLSSQQDAVCLYRPLAQALLSTEQPGLYNEALMELGATVCTPRKPLCVICPWREFCRAARTGRPEEFPRRPKKRIQQSEVSRLLLVCENRLLLYRTPRKSNRLADICELPRADGLALDLPEQAVIFRKKRSIANERIVETVYRLSPSPTIMERVSEQPDLFWADPAQVEKIALSGPHRKWIREIFRELKAKGSTNGFWPP